MYACYTRQRNICKCRRFVARYVDYLLIVKGRRAAIRRHGFDCRSACRQAQPGSSLTLCAQLQPIMSLAPIGLKAEIASRSRRAETVRRRNDAWIEKRCMHTKDRHTQQNALARLILRTNLSLTREERRKIDAARS